MKTLHRPCQLEDGILEVEFGPEKKGQNLKNNSWGSPASCKVPGLRHRTVFWLKWPVHDLVLVIPLPPLMKVASNTRPYSKLGGTTLNGRKEGG